MSTKAFLVFALVGVFLTALPACEEGATKESSRKSGSTDDNGKDQGEGSDSDSNQDGDAGSGSGSDSGSGTDDTGSVDAGSDSGNGSQTGSAERPLTISFVPPADTEEVTEYRLYAAMNTGSERHLVSALSANGLAMATDFRFKIDAVEDEFLINRLGQTACFYVTAVSAVGESAFSDADCKQLLDAYFP